MPIMIIAMINPLSELINFIFVIIILCQTTKKILHDNLQITNRLQIPIFNAKTANHLFGILEFFIGIYLGFVLYDLYFIKHHLSLICLFKTVFIHQGYIDLFQNDHYKINQLRKVSMKHNRW